MKIKIIKTFYDKAFWSLVTFAFFVPIFFTRAQVDDKNPKNLDLEFSLKNPLGSTNDLPAFIKKILDIVITIGVPIVALAIIYSGFLFIRAQGNKDKLKEAKDTFFYTIIGAAILLGAWILAQAIGATVEQFD